MRVKNLKKIRIKPDFTCNSNYTCILQPWNRTVYYSWGGRAKQSSHSSARRDHQSRLYKEKRSGRPSGHLR